MAGQVRRRPAAATAALTLCCACLAVPSTWGFASLPRVANSRSLHWASPTRHHTEQQLHQPRHHNLIVVMAALPTTSSTSIATDGGSAMLGKLTLVGAGPGDPELLTVKAVKVLATADLVIADRLISKEVLDLVHGELRVARKHPGCAEQAQTEIYGWVKEGLEAGKHVVRLKIGDPFVFGRGGEEVLEARSWGLEPAVVPGISSVFGAPLLAGIPVTHRGVANQVVLGTGYARDYGTPDMPAYHPEQTAVFLMAVGRLRELCVDLQRVGYPSHTPIAIVESASTPKQRVVAGTIASIVEVAAEHTVRAPATIVVGEVVRVLHGDAQGLLQDCALEHSETVAVTVAAGMPGQPAAAVLSTGSVPSGSSVLVH